MSNIKLIFLLLIVFVVVPTHAARNKSCQEILAGAANELVMTVRNDMLSQKKGFAVVDVPQLLSESKILDIYEAIPDGFISMVYIASTPDTLNYYGPEDAEQLKPYILWVQRLLQQALPEEDIQLSYVELKKYTVGDSTDVNLPAVEVPHLDGGYITVTLSFVGPGTFIQQKDETLNTAPGQAVILTAKDRRSKTKVKATKHSAESTPGVSRFLLVMRFEQQS